MANFRNVWEGTTNLIVSHSQTNETIEKEALFREREQVSRTFHESESQLH